jgi:hypothetical protein
VLSAATSTLRRPRARRVASILLLVAGSLTLLVAELTLWARDAVFDTEGFTDNAVRALNDEQVRALAVDRLVDQLVERGSSDLIAVQPLLQAATETVIDTGAFRELYATAVAEAHRQLFSDDPIVLQLVDALILVRATVAQFDPALAERLPAIDSGVIEIADEGGDFDELFGAGEKVARAARLYTLLTIALLVASVWVAPRRRRAVIAVGVALAVVAALVVVGLDLARATLTSTVSDELTAAAVGGVWDAFLQDLRTANLILGAGGVALAAAATSAAREVDAAAQLRRLREVVTYRPQSRWGRLGRALAILLVGWIALTNGDELLDAAIAVVGIYAIYIGLTELIRLNGLGEELATPAAAPGTGGRGGPLRRWLGVSPALRVAALGALFAVATTAAVALLLSAGLFDRDGEDGGERAGGAVTACNGHAALCERPLNDVAFATTHNSMSAASEGWLFASHRDGIAEQLEAGVRGLLLDVWYGFPASNGVRTELLGAAGEELQRTDLARQYGEEALAARDRVAESLELEGERGLFLCHGFCELGATPLDEALRDVRLFLDTHRGEVILIFVEDHAGAADIVAAFVASGLERYAYAHPQADAEWPTLGELVERDERLLVLVEKAGGATPWYHAGFELAQETPFSFASPEEFSCAESRGRGESPLFLLNHWIEDLTPSPADAEEVNARALLLARAEQCREGRERLPNLVAVNFYGLGDVFEVVDVLNGVAP